MKFLIYFPLISNCIPVYYIYIYVYESFGCYELCFPISLFYFIHLNVSQRILAFSFVGVGMWYMYYVKFMKLIAYIIHSKMILQVMLKGDKMATSHLILKDHSTKIPCTNMIKDICITFKVTHISFK